VGWSKLSENKECNFGSFCCDDVCLFDFSELREPSFQLVVRDLLWQSSNVQGPVVAFNFFVLKPSINRLLLFPSEPKDRLKGIIFHNFVA